MKLTTIEHIHTLYTKIEQAKYLIEEQKARVADRYLVLFSVSSFLLFPIIGYLSIGEVGIGLGSFLFSICFLGNFCEPEESIFYGKLIKRKCAEVFNLHDKVRKELHDYISKPENLAKFMQEANLLHLHVEADKRCILESYEKYIREYFVAGNFDELEKCFETHYDIYRSIVSKPLTKTDKDTATRFNEMVYGESILVEQTMTVGDLKQHI